MRGYADRIRELLRSTRGQHSILGVPVLVGFYVATLAYILFWFSRGPERKPVHFLLEGGAIDYVSSTCFATAAFVAWLAWIGGRGVPRSSGWFWLASTAGLAFLGIDERFQLHEHYLSDWQDAVLGPVPLGFRNWNDIVVIVYGFIALAVVVLALPAVLRYRWVWRLMLIGGALYVLHTFLDAAGGKSTLEELGEESCKLLSSVSILLAFVEAAARRRIEAAREAVARTAWEPGWGHVAGLGAICAAASALLLGGGEDWQDLLSHRWGAPMLWACATLAGAAALLTWLSALLDRRAATGSRVVWGLTGAVLATLSFDVATVACAYRFRHRTVRGLLPDVLQDRVMLLHGLWGIAVVVLALAVLTWLERRLPDAGNRRRSTILAAAGLVLLAGLAGMAFEPYNESAAAQVVLLFGCSSLLASAFIRFGGRTLESVALEAA